MVTAHLQHSANQSRRSPSAAPATVTSNRLLSLLLRMRSLRPVAWLYLICVLPTTIFLCFLIPPMQVSDEGRHFLRAYEFSRGQMLPDTGFSRGLFVWDSHGKPMPGVLYTTGGVVPAALANFVRDKVTSADFLLREYHFPSIASRLRDLDAAAQKQPPLREQQFIAFPGSAVYAPTLYLPQIAGISFARLISDKTYIWFYAARIANATASVLLVFWALLLAPGYELLLLVPAILPMALHQFSSASCDAGIISVSILFVSLCLRFLQSDRLLLRITLILCLVFLAVAKPVYLPFGLLLIGAYKRLGWRQAILFCSFALAIATGAYLAWSHLVRPFFDMVGWDAPNHNPGAQFRFTIAHPLSFTKIVLHSVVSDSHRVLEEMIGFFRWDELPLPTWFYKVAYVFLAALFVTAISCWKRVNWLEMLLASVVAISIVIATYAAGFILWTAVGVSQIHGIHGRYFLPVLALLPFFIPRSNEMSRYQKLALPVVVLGFFLLSLFITVRTLKHYYFPEPNLIGENIYRISEQTNPKTCPASLNTENVPVWFSAVASGTVETASDFRVLATDETGTILGESDPVLTGTRFPLDPLPKPSRSRWRLVFFAPNRYATFYYWLLRGKTACRFGPGWDWVPYIAPET